MRVLRAGRSIAEIEQRKQRRQIGPPQRQVNRAALGAVRMEALTSIAEFVVGAVARLQRSTHREIERAVQVQQRVADLLDSHTPHRKARKQPVIGILLAVSQV